MRRSAQQMYTAPSAFAPFCATASSFCAPFWGSDTDAVSFFVFLRGSIGRGRAAVRLLDRRISSAMPKPLTA